MITFKIKNQPETAKSWTPAILYAETESRSPTTLALTDPGKLPISGVVFGVEIDVYTKAPGSDSRNGAINSAYKTVPHL